MNSGVTKCVQLHVRVVLIGARGEDVVVQSGALFAFQKQAAQVGALGGVHEVGGGHLDAEQAAEGRLDDGVGVPANLHRPRRSSRV